MPPVYPSNRDREPQPTDFVNRFDMATERAEAFGRTAQANAAETSSSRLYEEVQKSDYKVPPLPPTPLKDLASESLRDFYLGAKTEITEHPLKVAALAAAGAATGIAATFYPWATAIVTTGGSLGWLMGSTTLPRYGEPQLGCTKDMYSWQCTVSRQLGAAAVDFLASLAGGVAGYKLAQTRPFAPLRERLDLEPNHFRGPSAFDEQGRPVKLPRANGDGSSYFYYDRNGKVSQVHSFYGEGYREFATPTADPKQWNVQQWQTFFERKLPATPIPYEVSVDASAGSAVIRGNVGTSILKSNAPSVYFRDAQQQTTYEALMAEIRAAEMARPRTLGAGVGLAMRPF